MIDIASKRYPMILLLKPLIDVVKLTNYLFRPAKFCEEHHLGIRLSVHSLSVQDLTICFKTENKQKEHYQSVIRSKNHKS